MQHIIRFSSLFITLIFCSTSMAFNPQPEPPAQAGTSPQTSRTKSMEPLDKKLNSPPTMKQQLNPGSEKMDKEKAVQTRDAPMKLPVQQLNIDPGQTGTHIKKNLMDPTDDGGHPRPPPPPPPEYDKSH